LLAREPTSGHHAATIVSRPRPVLLLPLSKTCGWARSSRFAFVGQRKGTSYAIVIKEGFLFKDLQQWQGDWSKSLYAEEQNFEGE
jgi:hypothetical protein